MCADRSIRKLDIHQRLISFQKFYFLKLMPWPRAVKEKSNDSYLGPAEASSHDKKSDKPKLAGGGNETNWSRTQTESAEQSNRGETSHSEKVWRCYNLYIEEYKEEYKKEYSCNFSCIKKSSSFTQVRRQQMFSIILYTQ